MNILKLASSISFLLFLFLMVFATTHFALLTRLLRCVYVFLFPFVFFFLCFCVLKSYQQQTELLDIHTHIDVSIEMLTKQRHFEHLALAHI